MKFCEQEKDNLHLHDATVFKRISGYNTQLSVCSNKSSWIQPQWNKFHFRFEFHKIQTWASTRISAVEGWTQFQFVAMRTNKDAKNKYKTAQSFNVLIHSFYFHGK